MPARTTALLMGARGAFQAVCEDCGWRGVPVQATGRAIEIPGVDHVCDAGGMVSIQRCDVGASSSTTTAPGPLPPTVKLDDVL